MHRQPILNRDDEARIIAEQEMAMKNCWKIIFKNTDEYTISR